MDEPTMGESTIQDTVETVASNKRNEEIVGNVVVIGNDSEDEDDIPIPSTPETYHMVGKIRAVVSHYQLDSNGAMNSKIEDGIHSVESSSKSKPHWMGLDLVSNLLLDP